MARQGRDRHASSTSSAPGAARGRGPGTKGDAAQGGASATATATNTLTTTTTPTAPGRRAEIVAAAGSLFRDHGYHATSMRDLAKSLNLQGGSLYAHIGSKEELLWEIVDAAAEAFVAAAEAVDPTLPPPERMRALVHGHLGVVVAELEHATVFFHEWTHLRPDLRQRIVERRDAYQSHFRRTVHDGVRDGSFAVDDPALATLLVLSTLNWSYQWLDPAGRLDLEALTEAYATFLLRALGAEAATSARGENAARVADLERAVGPPPNRRR